MLASGTPRPDYHGEWIYAFEDQPTLSGFRFQADEVTNPVVSGTASGRHFRLETDASGWWLVPGPGTAIYPNGFPTTALKCGVAADEACVDVASAPGSGASTGSRADAGGVGAVSGAAIHRRSRSMTAW